MNTEQPINVQSLTDEQLTTTLLQLTIQETALGQTKIVLVNELLRRQQQARTEQSIALPKLKKIDSFAFPAVHQP